MWIQRVSEGGRTEKDMMKLMSTGNNRNFRIHEYRIQFLGTKRNFEPDLCL